MGLLKQNTTVLLLCLLTLTSCGLGNGGVAPGGNVSSSQAKSCSAPASTVLDYGVRATGAAAISRGVWSDVKYIPSGVSVGTGNANGNVVNDSANVGVAYVDTGSQAIKYSYWNGSVFKTEVVYGNSAANITYLRLAYLSNFPNTGLPLIFFTNGAVNNGQIMMAVRSTASLSLPGTWSVQAIDAIGGVAKRALEVSVSPIDQVGLIYQATTLPTANNIRFVYCSSNCHDPANYLTQPNSAVGRIDNGAAATQINIGVAWCQTSSGVYNPSAVYGASATTFQFAICNTGSNDLTSCQSNAGWTRTTATMAATGASGTTSDLYIDPSILNDTPKIFVKDVGASRMKTFSTTVGCGSVVAGTTYTAFGTSAIVGSSIANYANSGLTILKSTDYANSSNERFFLVANDGTTGMRWSASSTSNFHGAWYANVAQAFHTVTLGAAGSSGHGAALNKDTKQIISAYGTAVGQFNITLGVVNDYTSPADPANANNVYHQLIVEGNGNIQLPTAQNDNISVAATSTSRPGVAWVDYSSGSATTGRLKYALRNGTLSSDTWQTYNVPGVSATPAPQYLSLAFDHNDKPWIGYWDSQGATGRFVLATNTLSDGSGTWTSYMFPVIAAGHGTPVAQPAANKVAVAMSYTNGVSKPVMIVIDNGTTKAVKSASLDPNTGAWSAVTTIESLALQGAGFLSAHWSKTSNNVFVAYQILTTGSVRVKYAASTDAGLTWPTNGSSPYNLSGLDQGEGVILRVNPATGLPGVAYYDRANSRLYYASCTQNCTGSSAPTFSGASSPVLVGLGINGLSAAGNSNLLTASLNYSASGDAYIVYNSGQGGLGGLYIIDNVGGTMPSTSGSTPVVPGVNGTTTNASATNGGIPWGQSVVRMNNGVLALAYQSAGNFLNVTTCGD